MQRLGFVLAASMPLTLALSVTALNGTAQAQSTQEAQPPEKAKPVKKKVCRKMTYTGTHMQKRVCQTVDQWIAETERNSGEVFATQAKGSFLEGQDASKTGPR